MPYFNRTEFTAINTYQKFYIEIGENVTNKHVQNFKYLNVSLNKKLINLEDNVSKICKGIICCLNSLWWENIHLWGQKKTVKSVACYGCEVWLLKREEQRKLLSLEIDYLSKSASVSTL